MCEWEKECGLMAKCKKETRFRLLRSLCAICENCRRQQKNPASTATQTINARMEAYFMGKMINANSHILILNLNCKSKRTNYNVAQKLHFLHSIRFESIHFSDHYGENHWRVNALGCLNWIRNKQGMKWNGDQCKQQQRAMVSTVAATATAAAKKRWNETNKWTIITRNRSDTREY